MGMYMATRELPQVFCQWAPLTSSQPVDKFSFSIALWEFCAVTEAIRYNSGVRGEQNTF